MTAVKDRRAEAMEPAIDYNAVRQRMSVQPVLLAYISERRIPREDANHPAVTTMTVLNEPPATVMSARMMVPKVKGLHEEEEEEEEEEATRYDMKTFQ